ncbi:cation-translocating P-type ATPase [Pontibacter sp. E15-1]|uniref:cation-translocating P-type ATPase n=1 Tax=Pontibacter sp. E15-1 TaxID=2919918 RepID=UPI001F4F55BE|nr:cation-translocating P-type ATPase [Pontibacter sp. E15-1]MCJ8166057.1 cation-translocating P-type ATPase [Pontibacter sp. E15-1]
MNHWHAKPKEEILAELGTLPSGLTEEQALAIRQEAGPNKLEEKKKKSPLKMLFQQFTETMVVILIVAAMLSLLLGKTTEAVAILAIVVLFGLLGFIQEYRADRAMDALNRMVVPKVRVRRNQKVKEIPATDLVPGDIVELEAGNVVPADLRITESFNLRIQEAALTGESEPIEKSPAPLPDEDIPLGDRKNMAYMGTVVTYGRGVGVAVTTGMKTELGKIAGMISAVEAEKTPLQGKLDKLGKMLALFGAAAAALIFGVGMLMGEAAVDMFLTAVSVAVAVVPEGLPAVVTITLALGSQRMLKRNALIRKLPAVETLGSVTVICSDKTGTLTENKMTVTIVDLPEGTVTVKPEVSLEIADTLASGLDFALALSVLCNDASHERDGGTYAEQVIGDPTETALLVAGAKRDIHKELLYEPLPRVNEVPFDSDRKRMSTIHQVSGALPLYLQAIQGSPFMLSAKGAPDSLLAVSGAVWLKGEKVPLDTAWRERILEANAALANKGMRVLGLAFRLLESPSSDASIEQDLVFVGLVGIIDPPRQEAKAAVEQCRQAGIRPVMITGDHPLTAAAIGRELRFASHSDPVTGEMIQKADEQELMALTAKSSVYARVSPEDKLRIVSALRSQGEIVAMTGDGVNDAPALRQADIGVAMGITGTDVAKEAADMVLLDDNFSTIVAAVEEGRVIFDNLLRFIRFSLAGNVGKVLIMLLGPVFGMVIALQPLQLLWLNLLTDGLLGLGLGTEPAEKDTMKRPPRNPEKGALEKRDFVQMAITGATIAAVSLGLALAYYNPADPNDLKWQTMIFATVGFSQVFQALALRSSARSAFALLNNPLMAIVVGLAIALQLLVIYLPGLEEFFKLIPLSAEDMLYSVAAGSVTFIVIRVMRATLKGS